MKAGVGEGKTPVLLLWAYLVCYPWQHCRTSPLLFPGRRSLDGVARGKQALHISLPCGAKEKYFGGEKAQIAHETSFHTPPDKA